MTLERGSAAVELVLGVGVLVGVGVIVEDGVDANVPIAGETGNFSVVVTQAARKTPNPAPTSSSAVELP